MKQITALFALVLVGLIGFTGCDQSTTTIDSAIPNGTFTAQRTGAFTAQNGTPTAGTIRVGTDTKGTNFVHLGTDFKTELGTGTSILYLSKTAVYKADPAKGNPDLKLIGTISKNGEQYYKLSAAVSSDFAYAIVWCATASVPFGNANVK